MQRKYFSNGDCLTFSMNFSNNIAVNSDLQSASFIFMIISVFPFRFISQVIALKFVSSEDFQLLQADATHLEAGSGT